MNSNCLACPRKCGADRAVHSGICGATNDIKIAKYMVHFGEEPPISGSGGSGAIFFSGCNLRCCFCQNFEVSNDCKGETYTADDVYHIMEELVAKGVHNINLVTPSHYIEQLLPIVKRFKAHYSLPIVYNSGGYDDVTELLKILPFIDICLPDLKYKSNVLSERYSKASNYFATATVAIQKMVELKPTILDKNGIMQQGVIIRHLILPSCYKDSLEIIDWLHQNLDKNSYKLSLMRQYVPLFAAKNFPEINRKLTTFEYRKVLDRVLMYEIEGFTQSKAAASTAMIPEF